MTHEPRSLALLRSANPVSVDPTAVHSQRATALFERIVAEPRDSRGRPGRGDRVGRRAGGRGLRARIAVGGVGIGAVAAAIIVAAISGSAAAPAFAGWRARPTVALPQQIADATRRCGLAAPALVEARGPYTAAVFVSRSGGTACVDGPSMSDIGSVGGAYAPDNPIKPNQVHIAVITGSDTEGDAFILLAGRVGSAVRSIVIHRSNHVDVIASVKNGWFLAWWPARAHATSATVTTSSGARVVLLPSFATAAPASCGGRPDTGCASVSSGSNGPGSAGVPGPPLILGPVANPFGRTLLFGVTNAGKVLACFHPPHNLTAALQPNGPTGPCTHAARVTRLPSSYPVQRNLLEVLPPNSVWRIKLPAGTGGHRKLVLLVVAFGAPSGQMRDEIPLNG